MVVLLFFLGSCKKDDDKDVVKQIPILSTSEVTKIGQVTAQSGGVISSDAGFTVTTRGVCWNTTGNPSITDAKTTDGLGAGSFTSKLTGLSVGTTYYLRAYATNSEGTAYGSTMVFETLGSTFIDSRDGSVYKMVTIGEQIWMAENLKYLPSVVDPATGSQTTPYYYVYGYDGTSVTAAKATTNYATYGALYNWPAACSSCPAGWHLPSDAEWTELTDYLGGTSIAGGKLKEAGTTHWSSPNIGATNETGFTALPAGNRNGSGYFNSITSGGNWWSTTEFNNNAWYRSMYSTFSNVYRYDDYKELGFSVRCIKD